LRWKGVNPRCGIWRAIGFSERVAGARIWGMATKERLHQLIDSLPDTPETELRLDAVEHQLDITQEKDTNLDAWGDLDAWSDAASTDTMRMLDEEEAAIGFSWEPQDSQSASTTPPSFARHS
jgi:hypothetical protein